MTESQVALETKFSFEDFQEGDVLHNGNHAKRIEQNLLIEGYSYTIKNLKEAILAQKSTIWKVKRIKGIEIPTTPLLQLIDLSQYDNKKAVSKPEEKIVKFKPNIQSSPDESALTPPRTIKDLMVGDEFMTLGRGTNVIYSIDMYSYFFYSRIVDAPNISLWWNKDADILLTKHNGKKIFPMKLKEFLEGNPINYLKEDENTAVTETKEEQKEPPKTEPEPMLATSETPEYWGPLDDGTKGINFDGSVNFEVIDKTLLRSWNGKHFEANYNGPLTKKRAASLYDYDDILLTEINGMVLDNPILLSAYFNIIYKRKLSNTNPLCYVTGWEKIAPSTCDIHSFKDFQNKPIKGGRLKFVEKNNEIYVYRKTPFWSYYIGKFKRLEHAIMFKNKKGKINRFNRLEITDVLGYPGILQIFGGVDFGKVV